MVAERVILVNITERTCHFAGSIPLEVKKWTELTQTLVLQGVRGHEGSKRTSEMAEFPTLNSDRHMPQKSKQ